MATVRWTGAAETNAQVQTVTVTGFDATTTYKVTINGKVVSTLGVTSASATAAALQALLAASTEPEFQEITWSVNSATITATANTAGYPFIFTATVSGGSGTFGSITTATANSGPNDVSVGANYSTGSTPSNGDDLYIDGISTSLLYNLQALSAITLNSLNVSINFAGTIGLPKINTNGSTQYYEYRQDYFQIGATTSNIGGGSGNGSGRIKIDNGSVAATLNVTATGTPIETGLEALLWKGTNSGNVVNVSKGSVGIAPFSGEAATVATLQVGFETSQASDATVRATTGVTLTTIQQSGGSLTINSAATTVTCGGGSITINGTGAIGTLTLDNTSAVYNTSGTLTTLTVGAGGASIDFSQDMRAKTITNKVSLYSGASFLDPFGVVTFSATPAYQLVRCRLADVTMDLGPNRSFTVA